MDVVRESMKIAGTREEGALDEGGRRRISPWDIFKALFGVFELGTKPQKSFL